MKLKFTFSKHTIGSFLKEHEAIVKNLGKSQRIRLRDDKVIGLELDIFPSGRKVFRYCYLNKHYRQRRITLGDYLVLNVEQARKKVLKLKQSVSEGKDPQAEKQEKRKENTFGEFAANYFQEKLKEANLKVTTSINKKIIEFINPKNEEIPKYISSSRYSYNKWIASTDLPNLKIKSVTTSDIAKVHRKANKTKVQGNRIIALMRVIFTKSGTGHNPVKTALMNKDIILAIENKDPEEFFSEGELEKIGKALEKLKDLKHTTNGVNYLNQYYAILLMLFSGNRTASEVLNIRRDEVDFEKGIMVKEKTKTGIKKKILSRNAIMVLRSIPKVENNPYFFPSPKNKNKPLKSIRRSWKKVLEIAGLKNLKMKDIRTTYGTYSMKFNDLKLTSNLLGHKSVTTTESHYVGTLDKATKEAEDKTSHYIDSLLKGKNAKVIKLQ